MTSEDWQTSPQTGTSQQMESFQQMDFPQQTGTSQAAGGRGTTYASTGRTYTEPVRELAALALLVANALFLLLGFARLLFVLDGWASGFGSRSAAAFPVFVGPVSLSLPIIAVLLATHVAPMLRRHRLILVIACVEYAVSAVFGFATFLGAVAEDLPAIRATLEGLLWRGVWLGLLVVGVLLLARLYLGLMPGGPGLSGRVGPAWPGTPGTTEAIEEPTIETAWPVLPAAHQPAAPHQPPASQQSAPYQSASQQSASQQSTGGHRQAAPRRPTDTVAPGSSQTAPPTADDPIEPPTRRFER